MLTGLMGETLCFSSARVIRPIREGMWFLNVAPPPHLSAAPASCPGKARWCGPGYQPSAVDGARQQR